MEISDSQDEVEARRDTVLNVMMSEIERYHEERNQDLREMSDTFVGAQLELHRKVRSVLSSCGDSISHLT